MSTDTARPGHAEDALRSPGARRFVGALREVEDRGDLEEMVGLGTDATAWWSTGVDQVQLGPAGARRFWEAYRRSYAEITSEFTAVTETAGRVVLEWTSRGRHHSGRPVRYAGATVLEVDDQADPEHVTGVRLYYDTAAALAAAPDDTRSGDGPMLDETTAASGRNSGLAPDPGT